MPDLMNHEWLEFTREFEKTDPEPRLHYMLRIPKGDSGYDSKEVDIHMAWHRRLTDAWMKRHG